MRTETQTQAQDQKLGAFGKYLLLKKLASGGMAEIFLARPATSDANGRVLVIKRILQHVADDVSFLGMFKSEIRICMGLNHPNIVQIHDFGDVEGQPYIAMEYVEGRNLKQIAQKFSQSGNRMPIGMAVSIATQAAAGLHYAHTFQNNVTGENLRVIHRDISPHNILLSFDGNVKIIDFGIAKATTNAERTSTGMIKGKACYVSPEQTVGEEVELDGRSDLFSLGIVLWEMLTGQRLFSGESDLTILRKVQDCEKNIQPPSAFNPEVPSELDAIVLKALSKDRERRYDTAAEFQKALRGFLMTFLQGYSYSDAATTMQKLFKEEISEDRRHLREVNDRAQQTLSNINIAAMSAATRPAMPSLTFTEEYPRHADVPHERTASRVMLLKKWGNKRVGWQHLVLFAIYVLTIVGIKLDEKYYFFDRFMLPTEVVKNARQTASAAQTFKTAENRKNR